MQCIDQAYWGIFPHFEVTIFLSDSVKDSSETCFYSWDYHVPHHFGYPFEIRFRVSPLRHWSILHSDFLADYCWAEDSWFMMLDSSFGCALDIHTRAYSPFIWLRWVPSGTLSLSLGIVTDQRSLVRYVETISVLVEHRWAPSGSIPGVLLR